MIPAAKTASKSEHLRWGEAMREDIEGGQSRLIDAALFCYRRFGPPHTRVVDVALQAHVTRVTFYRYFRNSDDLLNATIRRELTRLWQRTVELVPAGTRPSEAPVVALPILLEQLRKPDHQFLAHADTLPALAGCMLDAGYLTSTAAVIAPLLRGALPPGGLPTLFEVMNRAAYSYLHTPSPVFYNDEQLKDQLTQAMAPFIAWLLAPRREVPELRPATAALPA